ncbi:hypothetical protein BGZ46_001556 [Entomortierella lignicola]|nr:hypothetical protein BGZ46_001556 [Entomortierella lignicola]
MIINDIAHRLLVVPHIPNGSTTLFKQLPSIDGDIQGLKTTISLHSLPKDQFLKSTNIVTQSGEKKGTEEQKKEFKLLVIPKEDICKTAVIRDDHEYKEDEVNARDQAALEEYISKQLFRLKHGFRREEYALSTNSKNSALNSTQELRLIQQPQTSNFMLLVKQLQAMRAVAVIIQLEDVRPLVDAVEKCERVFKHHQKFDQVLASEPTQYEAIKALYELVATCFGDTIELVKSWAMVYHNLQELIQRIQLITFTGISGTGANGKTSKARRLFSEKSVEYQLLQIAPEALHHQKNVCINWVSQMRAFEQLARAYRTFVDQATSFALIQEIMGVGRYCGEDIRLAFEKSQAEFINMRQLYHLHYQIDYTNFNKILPKENALTTAGERRAQPPRPLFSRDMIGSRQLIRAGRLMEFILPNTAARLSKKKNLALATPKEYYLIVTSDMIYLCEVVDVYGDNNDSRSKSSRKSSQIGPPNRRLLQLLHEPVLVIDSQISSTRDMDSPPWIQKNMVMICFYNQISYILQAKSSEERDAWVECARQLSIEQPKPTDACQEQDENKDIRHSQGTSNFSTVGKGKGNKVSILKRLKFLCRSNINPAERPISEIDPDQITRTEKKGNARRMQIGQPSLWEVRHLPLDPGVTPPLEHPIPLRKSHLYDSNVKIVDLTTGKVAPGEFGMGIEDRAACFRDGCALFAVLRPARLTPFNEIDRQRDDFFLCCKRLHKREVMYVEPPRITDFYARSWLHPDMHVEFDIEQKSVMIAKMYRIICSTSEIVAEFQKYYAWLMRTARISPDNTFLCMDYRSQPLRIAKQIERTAGVTSPADSRGLEAGRKYTELGECNIEFRRMSNAADGLSVAFYNPATKRDMAIGVMVFDKSKVKATVSSLDLDAFNALGSSNGVMRVSPTEMTLTLWQTDARTRTIYIKGQRVFETRKSKSLDMFKITGRREALDELEEFMRVKNGIDCKAKDINETYKLIQAAFQDDVLDSFDEEEEEVGASKMKENDTKVKTEVDTAQVEIISHQSETDSAHKAGLKQGTVGTLDHVLYGYHADGYLETILEEEEEGEECILSRSTATFRPKSRSALILMERHQHELAAAEALARKNLNFCLPPIEPISYEDLAEVTEGQQMSANEDAEADFVAPSIVCSTFTTISSVNIVNETPALSESLFTTEVANASEPISELETQTQVNANGVVQARRYLLKKSQASERTAVEDQNENIEPDVDREHHMPIKDFKKKRLEEIYRVGI